MATSAISTGVLSAGTLVFNGKNRVNSISVFTDGTNAATIEIYDNTAASGKVAVKHVVAGAGLAGHVVFNTPVVLDVGLYVNVTGTGATTIVTYGG